MQRSKTLSKWARSRFQTSRKMLRRETDRRQRILDFVGDDLRHCSPGFEALRTQDFRYVLDDEQGRRLALAGEWNPHQRPVTLLVLGTRRAGEPESGLRKHVVPGGDELPRCRELRPAGEALSDAITRRHLQELARHAVGQKNPT